MFVGYKDSLGADNGRAQIKWGDCGSMGTSSDYACVIVNTSGVGVTNSGNFDNEDYIDAEWHKMRWWIHEATSAADSDRMKFWMDDSLMYEGAGVSNDPGGFYYNWILGANKDDGRDSGTESVWWGYAVLWTDPDTPSWFSGD
jgi:hypothetical protein